MKKVELAILAACFIGLSYEAKAVDIEVGFGETHYIKQADGIWYQDAFPYWMDTEDQNLSVGVSWQPTTIRYRAEFLMLGKHSVNGVATDDRFYNPYFVTHCGENCGLVAFKGWGSVAGLVVSASRDVRPFGLQLYVEGGLFLNHKKWEVQATTLGGEQLAKFGRDFEIDFGPVIGFGIRYSGVDIGLRYLYLEDNQKGGTGTPMMTGAYSLMFKAYF